MQSHVIGRNRADTGGIALGICNSDGNFQWFCYGMFLCRLGAGGNRVEPVRVILN